MSRRSPATTRSLPLAIACCAAGLLVASARAQTPGQFDTSFVSASTGTTIFALNVQNPGSTASTLFLGGDQDSLNRVNFDGTDTVDFVVSDFGGPARIVYTLVEEQVLNSNGQHNLLVGGVFGRSASQVKAGTATRNVYRIGPNGEIDSSFNPGKGANNFVTSILPLPDGGMVVGGLFDQFNAQNHAHIVRLDNSGAIVADNVFSSKLNFDDTVLSLAAQANPNAAGPQGQVLVAGTFTRVNGAMHPKLARVNADGSLDASFNPVFSDRVRIVVSQPDGKILAGGDFETVNGVAVKHLVRLNYDGTLDPTFTARVTDQPPFIAEPVAVNTITPAGGGSYYIGGNFAQVNGVARRYLARVLADGSVDSFDPGLVITNTVQQVALDAGLNLIYVGETRSKSVGDKNNFPPSLIRLYGGVASVSVAVKKPAAVRSTGQQGKFAFKRTGGSTTQPTTVTFSLSGTGASRIGVDYRLTNVQANGDFYTATIPANANSVAVKVVPLGSSALPSPETIIVTVVETDQSNPGPTASGTVTLIN